MQSENNQINILLVDDDEVDLQMTKNAFIELFAKSDVFQFYIAKNGLEALNKLYGRDNENKIPHPNAILLDIRMPKMDGITFLQELRRDPDFDNVFVYLFTMLYGTDEKMASQNLKVAGRIVKPLLHNDALSIYMNIIVKPLV